MWKPRGKLQFCLLAVAIVLVLFEIYNTVITRYPTVGNSFKEFKGVKVTTDNKSFHSNSRGWLDRFESFSSNDRDSRVKKEKVELRLDNSDKRVFPWDRYVHLDLKGAPPKVEYLLEFFAFIKRLHASGLLIEYEDMFPYRDAQMTARNAYTKEQIGLILDGARSHNLNVIPLVQTFGHMEFVLKTEKYKYLRESERYPQSICPSHPDSLPLIHSMIDDVMSLHPGIKHIHLGSDEVFTLGVCKKCLAKMTEKKWTKKQLFLDHVTTVTKYVRDKYPDTIPLIWDDELRDLSLDELEASQLGKIAEPVVWKYTSDVGSKLTDEMWTRYALVFNNVWIATAFKGAHQPNSLTTHANYYFENHESWIEVVKKISSRVTLKGGILTGWQRYDHFAVLCELLPVAVPSLTLNLAYLAGHETSYRVLAKFVESFLGCRGNPLWSHEGAVFDVACTFPGSEVYSSVNHLPPLLYQISQMKEESTYKGWMTGYNVDNAFSSPMQVEHALSQLDRLRGELSYLENRLIDSMNIAYDNYTIAEWLYTYVKPTKDELESMIRSRITLLDKNQWPRRPLELDEL